MPQFFPNTATLALANLAKTALALAKLRLLKAGFTPSISTLRADLLAEEADYTGYLAGGEEITAMLGPIYSPLGGALIEWPTVLFAAAAPYTVGNVIGGWWLETAAGAVYAIGTFVDGIPIGAAGQGLPLSGALAFPNGQ